MAPEQLEGREADPRTDILAFGVVLYEMLTGKKAFEATSQASLIAAILDRDPPAVSALQPLTPRSLERVVKKCLAKSPAVRWQSAADLCDELKWIAEAAPVEESSSNARPRTRTTNVYLWTTAASLLLAAGTLTLALMNRRPAPIEAEEIRFEVSTPDISNPRQITISPDGRWITFSASTANTTALFVRRIESTTPEQLAGTEEATSPFWARNVPTRFTFDPALSPNGNVVWAPDGRFAFSSERQGNRDIFVRDAIKFGAEAPLLATPLDEWPEDWSKDGRYLAYGFNQTQGGASSGEIAVLPLFGEGTPISISSSPFLEDEPRFSFDGRWLAYTSDESGRPEVYLMSFPDTGQKRQVSTGGGVQPRWRRDGRELYYLALDGTLMAADLRVDSGIDSNVPRPLFKTQLNVDSIRDQFAVSPDGQRFLVQLPVIEGAPTPITVVLDWQAPNASVR
jgi:hypothetical protein